MNRTRAGIRGTAWTGVTTGWLPVGLPLQIAIRVVGAGLLLGMAWIHQHLYDIGYATVPTIGPLFRLNAVLGFGLLAWREAAPEQARAEMTEVAGYFADGRLRTTVHARLPLAQAAEAHRMLDDRAQHGRILLTLWRVEAELRRKARLARRAVRPPES